MIFSSLTMRNCHSYGRRLIDSAWVDSRRAAKQLECRTEGDIETPFDVISMPYALRFFETESEFVRLASKTSWN